MSFDEIYDAYWRELYIVAYRKIRRRPEVEDLLQDIFLSVAERTEILEKQGSIRYYLHQALKNKIIDFYRKEAVKKTFDTEWEWLFTEESIDDAESLVTNREISALIQKEVSGMPERMREIHQLSRDFHLTNAEIAERLGISIQTVKNQLGVAMRRLRGALEDYRTYSLLINLILSYYFFNSM